jgi:hypothetical protein
MSDKIENIGYRMRWFILLWIIGMWINFLYMTGTVGLKSLTLAQKVMLWFH